jgi:hypothetical protein
MRIYTHFVRLLESVRSRWHQAGDGVPHGLTSQHPFRSISATGDPQPFELWTRQAITRLAWSAPTPDTNRPHPAESHIRTTHAAVATYLTTFRRTLRLAPPIETDVWFRIQMGMMPVNARLTFLLDRDPDVQLCSLGCGQVETAEHCFMSCRHVEPLWTSHRQAWAPFGVSLTWHGLLHVDDFQVAPSHAHARDELHKLWVLFIASTLHMLWQQCNHVKFCFDTRNPPKSLQKAPSYD